MNAFGQDLRHALRTLVKQPGYAALVVLTLALGVAANTAIYSVVHGVLLAPLPYEDAEDLMAVWGRFDPESGFDFPKFPLSDPEYLDYRDASRALEAVAAYRNGRATVTGGQGEPERVPAVAATADLFAVLRAEAALGRTFTAAEEQPGAGRVAVLQNGYWRSRFGGDPAVVGRSVILDGEPYEVVGVMPPGFAFPTPDVRLWTPLAVNPDPRFRQSHGTSAVGRLAKGATLAEAEAEMARLRQRGQRGARPRRGASPRGGDPHGPRRAAAAHRAVASGREPHAVGVRRRAGGGAGPARRGGAHAAQRRQHPARGVGGARRARPRFTAVLLGLFAAVALVLGGTGIYGVLAYSVALRRQEIGIRKALGARPGQLAAMVARQGLALVGVGLAIGAAASRWALKIMASLLYGVGLTDGPTYAAVAAVLGLVALLACALPMLRAVRLDPLAALRAE